MMNSMTMKRNLKKTLLFAALVVGLFPISSFGPGPGLYHPRTALHTIIIDPGHGGSDTGAEGQITNEKTVVLAISLKLGKLITDAFPDIRVVYTRTTDEMPGGGTLKQGLRYRADLANREKGDLFICVHANSNGHPAGQYEVRHVTGYKYVKKGSRKRKVPIYDYETVTNKTVGTTSYIWKAMWGGYKSNVISGNSDDGSGEGGENMGDSTATTQDLTSPEARIKAQLYEKKYFANSAFFGQLVQDEFIRLGRESEGVRQREKGIWVLEATGMPSVLIETGYVTNTEEEKYLDSEEGQNEIAQGIFNAFVKYKNSVEGGGSRPASGSDSTTTR